MGPDGIESQKIDIGFNTGPVAGIALAVTYPDMQVWQGDMRKPTLLRLNPFL